MTGASNSQRPWVYVHSSGLGPRQFERTLTAQGGVAVTLTGYDRPVEPDTWSWSDDLRRVLDAVEPHSFLFGHSYGGFLALQAALTSSARAVAVWEPVVWSVVEGSHLRWRNHPLLDRTVSTERWLSTFIGFWNGPGAWEAMSPRQRAPFEAFGDKVRLEVAALLRDDTPIDRWKEIDADVLLLRGEETIPEAIACCDALAELIPRARYEVVPGVGHMGPVTNEPELRARLERWSSRP